jgi:protein-S-isoprenylcysteine O-methyltransferase Ste14
MLCLEPQSNLSWNEWTPVSFALYVGSLIGILVAPLFMLAVARLHIDFEEEQLRKHFGLEWKHYEQRVRRWL